MYRVTTPTIILNIKNEDFDLSKIDVCHVTLKSEDGLHKVSYQNPEIDAENKQIKITMTQGETKLFNVGKIKIQIKAKLDNGVVIPSQIVYTTMKEILEEEEL